MRTNVIGWYGDSGSGKSSLIGSMCEFMRKRYQGMKGMLYTADNTQVLEPYIEEGLLDVYRVDSRWHPFETIDYVTRGYHPRDPFNEKTEMIAPTEEWFKQYLFIAHEGLTNYCDLVLSNRGGLAKLMGKGEHVGPGTRPGEDAISFKDGDLEVGGNSRSGYFLIQKLAADWVRNSYQMHVPLTIWTAHEVRATEDNKPIFGPCVAGKAATKDVQKWLDALIHCHTVKQGESVEYRLYLREHYDDKIAKGIPFKALTRLPLGLLKATDKAAIHKKWNELVPLYIDWTGDPDVMEKYMDLRKKMREAAKQLITAKETK